jgi:hypothetical protein
LQGLLFWKGCIEKKNDKKFLDENLDKVGHSPDVFRYIEDGYSILNALK